MALFVFPIFAVDGLSAQWEREAISERTAFALNHKRQNGQVYSRTPFGYDREGDTLILNPVQQKALATVKRMAAKGASLRQIANALTKKGIKLRQEIRKQDMSPAADLY